MYVYLAKWKKKWYIMCEPVKMGSLSRFKGKPEKCSLADNKRL